MVHPGDSMHDMLVFADRTMTLLDTVFLVQTNSILIVVFCPGDAVDTVGGATAKLCLPWSKHGIRYNKLHYCCYSMYTCCPLVHFLPPWHKPTCLFCLFQSIIVIHSNRIPHHPSNCSPARSVWLFHPLFSSPVAIIFYSVAPDDHQIKWFKVL